MSAPLLPMPAATSSNTRTIATTKPEPIEMHPAREYVTPDGYRIRIAVSASYDVDPDADQNLVNYLGSLVHGPEMDGLKVSILSPDEIVTRCGVRAAACYFPNHDLMLIVGESQIGGLPTDYVIAHEYGHRIAQFRRNPPFPGGAFWFGTKRWASQMRVCPNVRHGRLSIDRGSYWDFPGENFAEAYASLHHPGLVRWQFSPLLRPTARGEEALRADVLSPWRHPTKVERSGNVAPGATVSQKINTALDGRLVVDLRLRPRTAFTVTLVHKGSRVKAVSSTNGQARLTHVVCGQREFTLRLRVAGTVSPRLPAARPRTSGIPYSATISTP